MDLTDFPELDISRRFSDKNPAFRQIARNIRALIQAGILTPGDPVPSESALAEHLGICRGTVARGYATLADVLETVRGVGKRVRQPSEPTWAAIMKRGIGLAGQVVAVTGFPDRAAADTWGREREDGSGSILFAYSVPLSTVAQFDVPTTEGESTDEQ